MATRLTGGCACGAVRFVIDGPLGRATYCHCTRCQRRTGTAASANARVPPDGLRITSGEDRTGAWEPEGGWAKLFCRDCGSALFSRDPRRPERMGVRLGTIDGDPGVRPSGHQFTDYAAPWAPVPDDGLPRWPEARPEGA
ncbi:MAG: GFA family protein [Thermoleophilia bacterium]